MAEVSPSTVKLRADPALGRERRALLLAKGLNEATVAARRRKRLQHAARTGSEVLHGLFDGDHPLEPASYLRGAVLLADLGSDELTPSALHGVHAPEPFDAAFHGRTLAVAMADHVVLCDAAAASVRILEHPWYRQLHSVCFADDGRRLLLTSGDLDSILEVDIESGTVLWRWTSWENGYPVGADGTYIARSIRELTDQARPRKAILFGELTDTSFQRGLATAIQPAHVNAAIYSRAGTVLATLFHTGELLEIDPVLNTQRVVVSGLARPHAVSRIPAGYCVTDTQRGAWVDLDERFAQRGRIAFDALPGKDEAFGNLEWIQTIFPLADGLYAAVDSLRERIHLFDAGTHAYRSVDVPPSLILQAVRPVTVPDAVALLFEHYGTRTRPADL